MKVYTLHALLFCNNVFNITPLHETKKKESEGIKSVKLGKGRGGNNANRIYANV